LTRDAAEASAHRWAWLTHTLALLERLTEAAARLDAYVPDFVEEEPSAEMRLFEIRLRSLEQRLHRECSAATPALLHAALARKKAQG
jgi:hypothetical protein